MNKQTVKEKLDRAFERLWADHPKFRLTHISEGPVDGQWQASVEPVREEHDSRYEYYEELTFLEDELAQLDVEVVLLPALNPKFEFEEGGKRIEVAVRSNGDFAVFPKRSLGGPHYQALYDRAGNRILCSSLGRDGVMPVPDEWIGAFERVAERFVASPEQAEAEAADE